MPWVDSVAGVLEDWYPGQQDGSAIAALLFGDVEPVRQAAGDLPEERCPTCRPRPRRSGRAPNGRCSTREGVDVGYRWYQAKNIAPLFPFGFGLSYTSFGFTNLHVSALGAGGTATVTATVTNTGSRAGVDVAQLYVGDPASTGEPPAQLKGFQRVSLQPGASSHGQLPGDSARPCLLEHLVERLDHADRQLPIMVGDSSASPQLSGTLAVNSAGAQQGHRDQPGRHEQHGRHVGSAHHRRQRLRGRPDADLCGDRSAGRPVRQRGQRSDQRYGECGRHQHGHRHRDRRHRRERQHHVRLDDQHGLHDRSDHGRSSAPGPLRRRPGGQHQQRHAGADLHLQRLRRAAVDGQQRRRRYRRSASAWT